MSKKMTGFSSRTFRVFLGFCLVMTGSLFVACSTDSKDWEDDHKLNTNLIGRWTATGDGWTDTYIITENTVSHPNDWGTGYTDAKIEYVYNFNEAKTAGGIIVKKSDNKFTAVWFKDLKSQNQVMLGDAWEKKKDDQGNVVIDPDTGYEVYLDESVATLEEAKKKFSPANAAIYGGGSAQGGTPQKRQ